MFCFCSFVKTQDCSCICMNNLNNDFLFIACSVVQPRLTLCNPMDYSQPGSSVHGIFRARIVEWVAISYSREFSWPMVRTQISCVSYISTQNTWDRVKTFFLIRIIYKVYFMYSLLLSIICSRMVLRPVLYKSLRPQIYSLEPGLEMYLKNQINNMGGHASWREYKIFESIVQISSPSFATFL